MVTRQKKVNDELIPVFVGEKQDTMLLRNLIVCKESTKKKWKIVMLYFFGS